MTISKSKEKIIQIAGDRKQLWVLTNKGRIFMKEWRYDDWGDWELGDWELVEGINLNDQTK